MQTSISLTGVGTASNPRPMSFPAGLIQADAPADGLTTFRVLGKMTATAPWVELVAAGTADILQNIPAVPYVQLEVTAGTGTVTLYIG